jgi:hypothetical protein
MDLHSTAQLLGNLGEFVGAIAVVATLFYLAIQVRSRQRSRRSQHPVAGREPQGPDGGHVSGSRPEHVRELAPDVQLRRARKDHRQSARRRLAISRRAGFPRCGRAFPLQTMVAAPVPEHRESPLPIRAGSARAGFLRRNVSGSWAGPGRNSGCRELWAGQVSTQRSSASSGRTAAPKKKQVDHRRVNAHAGLKSQSVT